MSLQSLISGSECALPSNPLAQVLKHTDSDHSVQRDRAVGSSSSRVSTTYNLSFSITQMISEATSSTNVGHRSIVWARRAPGSPIFRRNYRTNFWTAKLGSFTHGITPTHGFKPKGYTTFSSAFLRLWSPTYVATAYETTRTGRKFVLVICLERRIWQYFE